MLEAVRRTVQRISIPLTVGGGIRNVDDIQALFDAGVSKISINTAAVQRPALVKEAADKFGSERITVAIDTRQSSTLPSGFEVVVRGGTQGAGIDAVAWARQVEELGAGASCPPAWTPTASRPAMTFP